MILSPGLAYPTATNIKNRQVDFADWQMRSGPENKSNRAIFGRRSLYTGSADWLLALIPILIVLAGFLYVPFSSNTMIESETAMLALVVSMPEALVIMDDVRGRKLQCHRFLVSPTQPRSLE